MYDLVDTELQSSPNIENPNETYDWKTTNNREDELVMAHNTNSKSSTLYLRTLYALYIRPNNNGIVHFMFKLSMIQILTTIKYQPVPAHENIFKTINE